MCDGNRFETLITALIEQHGLPSIGAGIVAAAYLGLAHDTRTFAKRLDLAHALVIRECVALSQDTALLDLENRGDLSQRIHYSLTPQGIAMIESSHV